MSNKPEKFEQDDFEQTIEDARRNPKDFLLTVLPDDDNTDTGGLANFADYLQVEHLKNGHTQKYLRSPQREVQDPRVPEEDWTEKLLNDLKAGIYDKAE
ncbi:MAG TPA: hypothetical protein VGG97_09540 [Bryobacteraceae bacterium]